MLTLTSTTRTMANNNDSDRSRIMRAVKSKDTKPEMIVRRLVHSLGYRYRLHRRELPGKPDLVFGARRKVVFIHGCFWHGHDCKRGSRRPKTNINYWSRKISRNRERDANAQESLRRDGWAVLVIWECELKDSNILQQRLVGFLENDADKRNMS